MWYLEVIPGLYSEYSYEVEWHFSKEKFDVIDYWRIYAQDDPDIRYVLKNGSRIKFETVDPVNYPLPDPTLISLRASITKWAYPTAAAGVFEDDISDNDEDAIDLTEMVISWLDGVPA